MKLTVLLDTFPVLSETFLYTTILNWQKSGLDVNLLARKRGQTLHEIPFQSQVRYLPSEAFPALWKFVIVFWFFLKLCFSPAKLKTAWNCFQGGNGFREQWSLAFRLFPLVYFKTEVIYFPFGGLAAKYLEYIVETDARVVFSLRGSDIHIDPLQSPSYRERLQKALSSADGVHCVCNEIKERADALCGAALSDTRVIYTALAPEFLATDFPEKRKISVDEYDLIFPASERKSGEPISVSDFMLGLHGLYSAFYAMKRRDYFITVISRWLNRIFSGDWRNGSTCFPFLRRKQS